MKILTALIIAAAPLCCFAAVDLHLHNTGVNSDNSPAAIGSVDQHYTNPYSTVFVSELDYQWASLGTAGRWVAPDLNRGQDYLGTDGVYTQTYSISFDLTNLDPKTVQIAGEWSTDNSGVILVNGVATENVSSTYYSFTPFTISGSSGLFRPGINTLDFRWSNNYGPGGIAVRFTSATADEANGSLPGGNTPGLLISTGGVVNSASFAANQPVAAGSLASVYGEFPVNTARGELVPLPYRLGGLSLQFSGAQAPLSFVSATQANVQIPWELAGLDQALVTANVDGKTSATQNVNLARYAPGIFTMNAQGQAAVVDALSGSLIGPSAPATAGTSLISIYGTGFGPVTNQPLTGMPASASLLSHTIVPPTVTIGGVPCGILFSGLAPTFVGLYQINAQVPAGVPPGDAVPLVVSIGGVISNATTIAVQR